MLDDDKNKGTSPPTGGEHKRRGSVQFTADTTSTGNGASAATSGGTATLKSHRRTGSNGMDGTASKRGNATAGGATAGTASQRATASTKAGTSSTSAPALHMHKPEPHSVWDYSIDSLCPSFIHLVLLCCFCQ
jgi:hypothetical protein